MKAEKLDPKFVKSVNTEAQGETAEFKLSQILHKINTKISIARSSFSGLQNPNIIKTECQHFASQRIAMYHAALEYQLYKTLIIGNDALIYKKEEERKSKKELLNQGIPKKFLFETNMHIPEHVSL